jgi:hypothetical protein
VPASALTRRATLTETFPTKSTRRPVIAANPSSIVARSRSLHVAVGSKEINTSIFGVKVVAQD